MTVIYRPQSWVKHLAIAICATEAMGARLFAPDTSLDFVPDLKPADTNLLVAVNGISTWLAQQAASRDALDWSFTITSQNDETGRSETYSLGDDDDKPAYLIETSEAPIEPMDYTFGPHAMVTPKGTVAATLPDALRFAKVLAEFAVQRETEDTTLPGMTRMLLIAVAQDVDESFVQTIEEFGPEPKLDIVLLGVPDMKGTSLLNKLSPTRRENLVFANSARGVMAQLTATAKNMQHDFRLGV